MINDDFKIIKEEKKIYPPLPIAIYSTELLAVDLVEAQGKYAKQGDKNFKFQWTLLEPADLRGRNIWDNFVPTTLYIGKKGENALWRIVKAFLKRDLTPQEEAEGLTGAFINSLVGKQIKIFVDHRTKDGNVYNNITSYIPQDTACQPLTEEEKENARVKNKKINNEDPFIQNDNNTIMANDNIVINTDEIPF